MDRRYWYWLNNIEGIGNYKIRELINIWHNPQILYNLEEKEIREKNIKHFSDKDIAEIVSIENKKKQFEYYEKLNEKNVKCVFPDEEEYPKGLNEIYDKPYVIYYVGKLPENNKKSIAIVGSRNCSEYGKSIAEELGRVLGKCDVNVISGLALGIDTCAHRGTVMSGGQTYAVLAGCPEKCYPIQNFNVYMDILKNGGILSEYGPGTPTVPGMFPIRNRIISGISEAVIIVEAGIQSGSLITANLALEQNRRIFAVPGRIGDPDSVGCNELINEGAEIITSIEGLLNTLDILDKTNVFDEKNNLGLAREEKMMYSLLLDFTPRSLEDLITSAKLPANAVFTALLSLEMMGLIKEISKNYYIRVR